MYLNNIITEKRLHIFDTNNNISFLVGSGSMVSLIPLSTIHQKLSCAALQLTAANQSVIHTYGEQVFKLNIGLRRDFIWSFIIADVQSAIIGADFLAYFNLLIDVKNAKIIDEKTTMVRKGKLCLTRDFDVATIKAMKFQHIINKYQQVTPARIAGNKRSNNIQHHIETTGPPVFERPRRLSGDRLKAAKVEVEFLLEHGICKLSKSPWASPLHMVEKKGGGWRACGDFRAFGLIEFLYMPFGLRNASQTFQRAMDDLFRGMDFVFSYIDDIIIMSNSLQEHELHVDAVLLKLAEHNLKVNLNKCQFAEEEVLFLGYTINAQGCKPPQQRVESIVNFPKPNRVCELRRFLGMLNSYRRCIPHAAEMQAPLNDFLKNSKKNDKRLIPWSSDSSNCFERCKLSIANAALLRYPVAGANLALTTDASDLAIGATLEQEDSNNWGPLAFFSRKLSPTEQKYSTYDRELLAIYKHFRHILEARHFIIKTDHKPLVFTFSRKLDKATPRQLRHLDFIAQYSTEMVYLAGAENTAADALSRVSEIAMPIPVNLEMVRAAQEADEELEDLLNGCSALKLQKVHLDDIPIYCDVSTSFVRPYVPKSLRYKIFISVHSLSHPSGRATMQQIRQKFVCPSMKKDITSWSCNCLKCQRAKIHRHNKLVSLKVCNAE